MRRNILTSIWFSINIYTEIKIPNDRGQNVYWTSRKYFLLYSNMNGQFSDVRRYLIPSQKEANNNSGMFSLTRPTLEIFFCLIFQNIEI